MPSSEPATATANSQRKNSARDDSLSLLAGRLGDQLFDPQAERIRMRSQAHARDAGETRAELETRIVVAPPALLRHSLRPFEQAVDVEAHDRCGHHPERRQRRVAPADRGLARHDLQEAVLLREPLEVGPWIGDRDERAALGGEVGGVRARLQRRAGLRRGDEERLAHVQRVLEATDRRGVRRLEHVEVLGAEQPAQHLGRETRAAHAEEHDVLVAGRELGCAREVVALLAHALRLVEPAEPPRLVRSGPDGRIPRPDPLDQVRCDGHTAASASRFSAIPCFSSTNESVNFCTPSFSSVSVTSS